MTTTPELGSFNDFVADKRFDSNAEAVEAYSDALTANRLAKAALLGISEEELHRRQTSY